MQTSVCGQVQQMMVAANYDPTDTVWGSLMVACGQAGQLETALTLWQAFKRARGGLWNMKNAEPWCAMLIACAQTYHLQPALTVLSDMRKAGNPVSFCLYDSQSCILRPLHVHSSRLPWEGIGSVDKAFARFLVSTCRAQRASQLPKCIVL